jgi:hypothetical protein
VGYLNINDDEIITKTGSTTNIVIIVVSLLGISVDFEVIDSNLEVIGGIP